MAKIDKMEMKYKNLKILKFNKEELEKKKAELKGENQNYNQTNKEEKNGIRVKLGKINYEISKLTEKNKLTFEEKTRLEYLKQQRSELKSEQRNSKNDQEEQNEIEAEKEMNLLEGFVKNEEKIDKILVYRDKIKKDLENLRLENKTIDLEISKIGNKADLIIECLNLKNEIEEAKKPDSKVSNEDYLKMVAKLNKTEESMKKLNELETKSKKIAKLIKSKQMAVTKCNLAWKCLFRNQTWDDIQLKAIKIKDSRIKYKEEITKNEDQKIENIESEDKENIMRRMKTWFFKDKEEEEKEEQQEETKEMVEYDKFAKKHPKLAKIRDFFKNRFSRNNKSETKEEEQNKVNQETKEEVKQENKKDVFIDELRRIVEKDDRQDIAQGYIEKHKKVNKEETIIDEER